MSHCYRDLLPADLLKAIDKLISHTANASGQLRNFIVHGQPFHLDLSESGKKDIREIWIRVIARKGGVRGHFIGLTQKYVDEQAASIKKLIALGCGSRKSR